MKRKILALSLLSLSASAQVHIEGKLISSPAKKVYLQEFKDKIFYTIDSAVVKEGTFSFHKNITTPEVYGLTLDQEKSPVFLYLDEQDKNIRVELDSSSYYKNTKFSGSSAQDIFEEYKSAGRDFDIKAFINKYPKSVVSAYVLYRNFAYRLEADQIREYLGILSPELQNSPYVKNLKAYLETLELVKIGQKAPDFTLADTEGKSVRLSDNFGKYLLVDFWAAWCGPCRKENPNVVAAYQKYHELGFDVFGVSLDRTKEAWIKAIEKDQLTWTHVSDLQYWKSAPAALYGVRAIPANFLLAPDGTIVAKNLKGKDLHDTLEQLLGSTKAP